MPAPVRLGLAGGPLVVAVALSRIGRIGPLLWYVPANANVLLRDFGTALFLSCVGLLAGSMTDPPARAFANTVSGSIAPSVAYATVYPLTMLLRILVAQLLVLLFCG